MLLDFCVRDSRVRTKLKYINSTEKLPVFAANRVGEILESTTVDEWHHVQSGDNPADTGTRGISSEALKVRRSTEKRWRFLFTCLTTRAVHLEFVPSLDTSSCVMGIERFIARRGTPSTIWSDNGTNFVGAEKELLACIKS